MHYIHLLSNRNNRLFFRNYGAVHACEMRIADKRHKYLWQYEAYLPLRKVNEDNGNKRIEEEERLLVLLSKSAIISRYYVRISYLPGQTACHHCQLYYQWPD